MSSFINRLAWYFRYRFARLFARWSSRNNIKQASPVRRILVLCYGNIYRSPFVERYLRERLAAGSSIEVRSAGFHAKANRSSHSDYIELVSAFDVNLLSHRSQKVSDEMLSWADLVLIMDGKNYKLTLQLCPACNNKLVWLGAFKNQGNVEIDDPYGQDATRQLEIVNELVSSSDNMLNYIAS